MLSQKGQMFAGYRLLIGAIMATMMLMIVLGGLAYVENIKYRISIDRLYEGAENAANTPNRDIIVVENLTFAKGASFSQRAFSLNMGIPQDCVTFDTWQGSTAFELGSEGVTVKEDIQTNVYFQCWLAGCGDLGVECTVSFGKAIE